MFSIGNITTLYYSSVYDDLVFFFFSFDSLLFCNNLFTCFFFNNDNKITTYCYVVIFYRNSYFFFFIPFEYLNDILKLNDFLCNVQKLDFIFGDKLMFNRFVFDFFIYNKIHYLHYYSYKNLVYSNGLNFFFSIKYIYGEYNNLKDYCYIYLNVDCLKVKVVDIKCVYDKFV